MGEPLSEIVHEGAVESECFLGRNFDCSVEVFCSSPQLFCIGSVDVVRVCVSIGVHDGMWIWLRLFKCNHKNVVFLLWLFDVVVFRLVNKGKCKTMNESGTMERTRSVKRHRSRRRSLSRTRTILSNIGCVPMKPEFSHHDYYHMQQKVLDLHAETNSKIKIHKLWIRSLAIDLVW